MYTRQLMIAIAALSVAAGASAEPAKDPVVKAQLPTTDAAPVTVAIADVARNPVAAQTRADPVEAPKRRARVTTCRCGGQTASN